VVVFIDRLILLRSSAVLANRNPGARSFLDQPARQDRAIPEQPQATSPDSLGRLNIEAISLQNRACARQYSASRMVTYNKRRRSRCKTGPTRLLDDQRLRI
jgi:hypothetical protein